MRRWLASLANRKSDDSLISSYAYGHDDVGNRISMTEANGDVTSYTYDDVYRLTDETKRDSGSNVLYRYQYTYDGVGNRLTENNTGEITYTYDANNKLTQLVGPSGTTTFGYDDNGNMTSMTNPGPVVTTYGYDYENRLTSVDSESGYEAAYAYSADGLRLRVQENNHTYPDRWVQYDGVRPVLEGTLDGDTYTTNNRYVLEGDTYYDPLIFASIGGNNRYYLYDGLGSTRQLLDGSQTVTDAYHYEAFGNVMASTGTTPNPYKYVGSLGYYQTGSSLMHLGARYYLPEIGRFLTLDPTGRPSSHYCESSPATCVDPTGSVGVNCPGQNTAEHQRIRWAVKAICTPQGQAIMKKCAGVGSEYLANWCASGTVQCGSRKCVKHPNWGGHDDPRTRSIVYLCVDKAGALRDDPLRVLIHEIIHNAKGGRPRADRDELGRFFAEPMAYACGGNCETEMKKIGLY